MADINEAQALYDELIQEADDTAAASGVYTNAGKFLFTVQPRQWRDGQVYDITPAEYKALPKSSGQKEIALVMGVDVQELKTDLEFTYERTVVYRKKDWYDTLKPSVATVFNIGGFANAATDEERKKIMREMSDKEVFDALLGMSGKYVFVSDVNSTTGKVAKTSQKPIKTIRIDKVFDTRAEFMQAYQDRFGAVDGVAIQSETVPPGYASIHNFKSDVNDLRTEGMGDEEIARELSVSIEWVSQV
jgi:hypothetical protein